MVRCRTGYWENTNTDSCFLRQITPYPKKLFAVYNTNIQHIAYISAIGFIPQAISYPIYFILIFAGDILLLTNIHRKQ